MEIGVAILYVVLGIILGAVGQGARAIIGVKKAADEAAAKCLTRVDEWFARKTHIQPDLRRNCGMSRGNPAD